MAWRPDRFFLQFFYAYTGIVLKVRRPPFQFIIHYSCTIQHYVISSTDSFIKETINN